jgi:hypothetical protein
MVSALGRITMKNVAIAFAAFALSALVAPSAHAFCGFYVAKADAKLFNEASQVVLVRDGDRTVLTMANDYQGELKEFAIVVPVPTVLQKEQIHVANQALIDHLDAYTAPRLVEYFDKNPCARPRKYRSKMKSGAAPPSSAPSGAALERNYGVKIEAKYTVGEYDILILSAKESGGLERWLKDNQYRIPDGASKVLGSYIKQGMKFFVAKVNLKEQAKLGFTNLRPLQMAYEHAKFMLPIRLGMVNAKESQELFVYTLTRTGRVETTNYRTVKLPTGQEIPPYIKQEFGPFYKDMFNEQVKKEGHTAVFTEYAWDMNWCDPCAADPLSAKELRELGVFWVDGNSSGIVSPQPRRRRRPSKSAAQDVYVTRLHVRYDAEHFPNDLTFHTTGDRTNFQGRYVLRHPWTGNEQCAAADRYRQSLAERQEREAQTLATLTGWDINAIRPKIPFPQGKVPEPKPTPEPSPTSDPEQAPEPEKKSWWQRLWD